MMKTILKLEEQLKYHKLKYYLGKQEISDQQYDQLEDDLRSLDPDNYVLKLVGTKTNSSKIKHNQKMLSLEKTYSIDHLLKWIDQRKICATYKIDGNSCSLIYESGKLVLAKSRGDGIFGENITDNIKWVDNIPHRINSTETIEIRGELYCDDDSFLNLSDEMKRRGLERPVSSRNIVAGLLGRKDNLDLNRFVKFMAFDLLESQNGKVVIDEFTKFKSLKKLDFLTPSPYLLENDEQVIKLTEDGYDFFNNGNYSIDGIVFTYNDLSIHKELGFTSHHPKFKMAFKFKGETRETIIEDITWAVSRNGILTPVAKVTPVEITGANISKVTLHNWGLVHSFNLKIGDKIEIIRSGEVIPKYLHTVKESEGALKYPLECPTCNSETVIDGVWLKCVNRSCLKKKFEEILYFIQKIGIDDLSKKRLLILIDYKKISDISDLYQLKLDDFLQLPSFKETLSSKIIKSINNSKNTTLVLFLTALGLRGGGFNKCELIVKNGYNSITKIINMTIEDLIKIDGFSDKSSTDFLKSFHDKLPLVNLLLEKGFHFSLNESNEHLGRLEGLSFCITGTLSRKRSDIVDIIRKNNGVVKSSINKDLSFLITNDKSSKSSKLEKAQKLKIELLSEDQFFLKWNLE